MSGVIRIVIIDDNMSSLELLSTALEREGLSIHTANDPREGLELIRSLRPRMVITDLVMPGMTGLEVLRQVMHIDPTIDVLLMTAHYTTETAVEAIRNGAADYLQKPVKIADLRERVRRLLEAAEKRRIASSGSDESGDFHFEGLVAKSEAMWNLFAMVEKVAPHFRSLLIQGPTGSGKDLIARALHERSGLKGKFVVLNCSAVVETLFESELFGHVRGAFTGADRDKTGLFQLADGGTLFLDEIGDMPLNTQAKLLRAIQNQEVMPVGSLHAKRVNVRIVAATHRNLRQAVKEGRFREDFYYRLSMVELTLPPLAARKEDISLLSSFFLRRFAGDFGKKVEGISQRALRVLERYSWPGNVRELEHVVGRACMLTDNVTIDVKDLSENIVGASSEALAGAVDDPGASVLDSQERAVVERILRETNWNQSEAARKLGIGRDALRYKMKKYGLGSRPALSR
ncbi:sigma-54-dependent Fis family transcriptional regulator [Terriglobus albidus]|uniref:Sigma-54-dependent Fis family transcriptional regulator n=1 Tax=Terriglobus albidus TaxID=1592106 RepID=A0A5B9EDG3_9BACT|nr:sigma-54 dependent transcriptional regulator [Terriglobus albidus]QEE30258.1 sigma-54-dependent Fis family transcriptional regulator [Terriglobus albidus]